MEKRPLGEIAPCRGVGLEPARESLPPRDAVGCRIGCGRAGVEQVVDLLAKGFIEAVAFHTRMPPVTARR